MPRPKGSKNKPSKPVAPVATKKKVATRLEDLYDQPPVSKATVKRHPLVKVVEVETPKRKPGRPPKVVEPVIEEEEEYEEEEEEVAPLPPVAKRGRGRPPKVVEPVEEEDEEEEEDSDDPFASVSSNGTSSDDGDDFFGTDDDEEFSEDFTGETSGSRLAVEGAHRVKCLKIEKTKTKAGDPMYVWDFVIVGGSGSGITMKLYTSLSSAARWKVIETLEAMGIEASNRTVSFKASDVVGVTAIANVVHDNYEGKINNKIAKLLSEDAAEEAGIELAD